jgi:hypothetical protein
VAADAISTFSPGFVSVRLWMKCGKRAIRVDGANTAAGFAGLHGGEGLELQRAFPAEEQADHSLRLISHFSAGIYCYYCLYI